MCSPARAGTEAGERVARVELGWRTRREGGHPRASTEGKEPVASADFQQQRACETFPEKLNEIRFLPCPLSLPHSGDFRNTDRVLLV